jgi:hypothetical protein
MIFLAARDGPKIVVTDGIVTGMATCQPLYTFSLSRGIAIAMLKAYKFMDHEKIQYSNLKEFYLVDVDPYKLAWYVAKVCASTDEFIEEAYAGFIETKILLYSREYDFAVKKLEEALPTPEIVKDISPDRVGWID